MGKWSVTRAEDSNIVCLLYSGHMKGDDGLLASQRFVELMGNDSVDFFADFLDLETYETRVRTDWQKVVFPKRRHIRSIHVASTRMVVRMGVSAFALFIGKQVTFYDNRDAWKSAMDPTPKRAAG